MIAIAPTHLIYIHRLGELYTFWCGAIVLSVPKGNARSPRKQDKTNIASTPFLFIIHHRKQVSVNILIMTKMQYNGKTLNYQSFLLSL